MKRIEWIDCAKGIAILAIIAGHLGCTPVSRLVFPWHVPLFFIVAGFFLSKKGTLGEFLVKKAKALLVPFLLAALAVICCKTIVAGCAHGDPAVEFRSWLAAAAYGAGTDGGLLFEVREIGAIWFLEALFWAVLLVRICLPLRGGAVILFVLGLGAWISARFVWLPLNLQSGALGAILVWTGRQLYQRTRVFERTNGGLVAVGVVAFVCVAVFDRHLYLVRNICTPFNFTASVAVSYAVIALAKGALRLPYLRTILLFYGTNSLLILCFHLFELQCLPLYGWLAHCLAGCPWALLLLILFLVKACFAAVCVALWRRATRPSPHML